MVRRSIPGALMPGVWRVPSFAALIGNRKVIHRLAGIDAKIRPRVLIDAWCGDSRDVKQKPALAPGTFATTSAKAGAYCNGHPQQTAALLQSLIGMDVETVLDMASGFPATRLAFDLRDEPLIDAAAKYKVIPTASKRTRHHRPHIEPADFRKSEKTMIDEENVAVAM